MSHAPSNGGRVSRTPWPCRLQPRPPSRTQPAEQMPQSFGSLLGPAGLLLGSLYTGLSFALGHSSKSKEGCVGDRLTLPRPARRGRPSPAPPASELVRSRGPPGARHPRRPLMPSPPALLPRDSRRRTIARIVLINAKEVVPPANRARPPGQSPPGHVGPTERPGGISSNTWGLGTTRFRGGPGVIVRLRLPG